jgi:RNA polymerase sigma-70 factor, ECF subfamily
MDDETRLIRAMANRDRAAWAKVYDRHVGDVFGLVYHLLGADPAAAEDVSQEVWLLAIENFVRYDPARGSVRDWLLGIARHRALRWHRVDSRRNPNEIPERQADALSAPELVERVERADMVRAGLLCLEADRRQVLLDKYITGASVAEIAARTNRSVKAVESLLSRARAQLRDLLQPYFSTPTRGECHEPRDARPA